MFHTRIAMICTSWMLKPLRSQSLEYGSSKQFSLQPLTRTIVSTMPNNPNQALEQPNSSELEDIELHAQRIHNIRSRNLSLQEARPFSTIIASSDIRVFPPFFSSRCSTCWTFSSYCCDLRYDCQRALRVPLLVEYVNYNQLPIKV